LQEITTDVTTVEHIVETMENRYGKSDRIWVMDRGMVSEENIDFLLSGGRRYIVGTPKSMLKQFEADVLADDWNTIRDGLEVKLCRRPREAAESDNVNDAQATDSDKEIFILCRSRDRSKKEEAMMRRSEEKIAARLSKMKARCEQQKRDSMPFSFFPLRSEGNAKWAGSSDRTRGPPACSKSLFRKRRPASLIWSGDRSRRHGTGPH
jgi:transposase